MCLLRCLHPPAGALALLVVLADPDNPPGLGRTGAGDAQRRVHAARGAGLQQPDPRALPEKARRAQPCSGNRAGPGPTTRALPPSLHNALQQMDAFIDNPEDLEELIRASEQQARRRSIGEVFNHNG